MFCEQCGSRLDENQAFCPNCGKRVGSAPAKPYRPQPAPHPRTSPLANVGFLQKFNAMNQMEQIFYGCTAGLLVVCFILSLLKVYALSYYGYGSSTAFSLASGAGWLLVISNILFTLSITFVVLEYMGKLSGLWIYLFVTCAAALVLLLFVIKWIVGVEGIGIRLSVGGWFFLIFQICLVASSVLLLLEKIKSKKNAM